VTFPIVLDGLQSHGVNNPEGGEITVNLVVFVWELDVVLCDAFQPKNKKQSSKVLN